jgi:V8-like Glu-specific endopeptidase
MWKFTELTYFLASLYYRQDEIESIIINSGHSDYLAFIKVSYKAIVYWTNIIVHYEQRKTVKDLLLAVLNDGHRDNEYLNAMLADENTTFKSPYTSNTVTPLAPPGKKELEKLTQGKSTLLPISFLEMGIKKSKPVVRIVTSQSLGSGFLLKNKYLLTNNHVIDSMETAAGAEINLNYQSSLTGALLKHETVMLDPYSDKGFATSVKNDWTIVKLRDFSDQQAVAYEYLPLNEVIVHKDDFVNIIQHPGGETKQIGLYHNVVMAMNDYRVQYLTDTLPGSSGSPVFNTQWEVVALHHSGGTMKLAGTKDELLVNEGININLVIKEIEALGFERTYFSNGEISNQ